jgi:23S rRNA pseudouridine1911/1915/1917 synthase
MQSARVLEVAAADAGRRLDAFLAERLGVSRAEARRLLARGGIRVDGRPLGAGAKGVALRAGECVEVADATPPEERRVAPEPDAPLALLAEGEGWLVADKPAGVPVHPLEPGEHGTLLGAVAARRPGIDGVGEGALRSGVVHRLDVDTSGAIVLATSEPAWQRLRAAFRARQVTKVYRAIAQGRVEPDAQRVELPLVTARHRPAFVRAANEREQADARLCRTSWQVLERLRGATLLEVRTGSGFLHQVRATLAHLGHPLAGDRTYALDGDASGAPRQMLHAARLAFEEIDATSPDPDDFRRVLESLRG